MARLFVVENKWIKSHAADSLFLQYSTNSYLLILLEYTNLWFWLTGKMKSSKTLFSSMFASKKGQSPNKHGVDEGIIKLFLNIIGAK